MALISTIARSNGTSLESPACTAVCPSPGYENTCSTSTAPLNNSLNDKNCKVIAGRSTFLRVCLSIKAHPFSPRAFAKST